MLISIVTPSLDQAAFIGTTLESVRSQDHPAREHIVMDGGSTDGTLEILQRYEGDITWNSQLDAGQSDAIARGFERSRGDILGWLNADDVLLPGALRRVSDYFEQHADVEAVSGGCHFVDERGEPLLLGRTGYSLGVPATFDRLRFYGNEGVWQPATFFRRTAYEAVGGVDTSLHYSMDYDLLLRLARRRPLGVLPYFLACCRLHAGCKSVRCAREQAAESARVQAQYLPDARAYRFRRAVYRGLDLWRKARLLFLRRRGQLVLHRVGLATSG
jgi:glycosyltransferase involved in cell wall biosynthesis